LLLLAFVPNRASIDDFLALDVDVIRLWASWTYQSPDLVRKVQSAGAAVWVNTRALEGVRLRTVLESGVDAVITDRPLEAMAFGSPPNLITTD
jgi:glycerophosphoryl diester phosphodiesterase